MTDNQQIELPPNFDGTVRLFPLPNLVMFPHVVQPLHIFEPRYVQMLEDAVSDTGLIAMAFLQSGWEEGYDDAPRLHPVVCLGRVITHTRLEDGRYNLLLMGLRRATVLRELETDRPYRSAEVAVLEDLYSSNSTARQARLESELMHYFRERMPNSPAGFQQFEQFAGQKLPLGVLTDLLAYSLDLDLDSKQRLLGEWNVEARAGMLLERLQSEAAGENARNRMPPFSNN